MALNNKEVIGRAIVFIENNLYEPLTASMVADAVSYSYYHFHRYFQATIGETIGSYIRSRRLTQAAYELVHSNKRILDIAISLYFESAQSFTRAFKKRYGIVPSEYRKNKVDVLITNHEPIEVESLSVCDYGDLVPEIIVFQAKYVAGFRFKMSIENNNSVAMWEKFNMQLLNQKEIPLYNYRYSIYEANDTCQANTFNKSSQTTAFIGIEIPNGFNIPNGMQMKKICSGKYAKFMHKGTVESLIYTYRYIWGVWFPQSGFQLADRDDFECYTERFLGPKNENSQIDIYFPIL